MRRKTPRNDRAWRAITETLGHEISRLRDENRQTSNAWHAERTARLQIVDELTRLRREQDTVHLLVSATLGRHIPLAPGAIPDAVRELAHRARSTAPTDTIDFSPTRQRLLPHTA